MFTGWKYRKTIEINSQAQLNDYQLKIELNSSNFDFSKAKTDGGDIRFADSNKTTELPYWIEKWDHNNQQAILWVKVPEIPSGTKNIYMYYGNPDAESKSNGDDVFEFFDDASDNSKYSKYQYVDIWNPGEFASLTYNSNNHEYIMEHSSGDNEFLKILGVSITNCSLRVRFKFLSMHKNNQFGVFLAHSGLNQPNDKGYLLRVEAYVNKISITKENGGYDEVKLSNQNLSDSIQQGIYYDFEGYYSNGYIKANLKRLDGTEIASVTANDDTYSYNSIGLQFAYSAEVKLAFKDVIVRKYTQDEPTISIKEESVGTRFGWNTKLPGKGYKACIYTSRMSRIKNNMAVRSIAKVYPAQDSTISIDTVPQVESDSSGSLSFYVDTNDYDLDQTFDVDIYKPNGEFYVSFKNINVYNIGTSINNINNYFETEENINKGDVVVILTNGKIKKYNKSQRDIGVDFEVCPGENISTVLPCFLDKNNLLAVYTKYEQGIYARLIRLTSFSEEPERLTEYLIKSWGYERTSHALVVKLDKNRVILAYGNPDNGVYVRVLDVYDDGYIVIHDEVEIISDGGLRGITSIDNKHVVITYYADSHYNKGVSKIIRINDDGTLDVGSSFSDYCALSGFYDGKYLFMPMNISNNIGIAVYEIDFENLTAILKKSETFISGCDNGFSNLFGFKEGDNKTKMFLEFGKSDTSPTSFYTRTVIFLNGSLIYPGSEVRFKTKSSVFFIGSQCYQNFVCKGKSIFYCQVVNNDFRQRRITSEIIDFDKNNVIQALGEIFLTDALWIFDGWFVDIFEDRTAIGYLYYTDMSGHNYYGRILTMMERSYPVIGIALEDASAGGNVKVATSGNVDVFENLKKGRIYYVDSDGNITLDETDIKIGVALDEKTIALQIQQ